MSRSGGVTFFTTPARTASVGYRQVDQTVSRSAALTGKHILTGIGDYDLRLEAYST